jgi:predicted nucleotidyltransferase
MKFGLNKKTIDRINSVFESFPQVEKVVIYGSRTKGNHKIGSDIDLTIIGKELDLKIINNINLKIEELLLPYIFDISIYERINNMDLLQHIERAGKVFYQKK